MDGPLRFSEIAQAIPELSDRLLSERMKELEARGIVERTVLPGPPLRVQYELSQMGSELEPALTELQSWARRWLGERSAGGRAVVGPRAARASAPPSSQVTFRAMPESPLTAQPPLTAQDVLALVQERDIRFIRLWFTDILGQLKAFSINVTELADAFEGGMGFDGSSITGFNAIEESDMIAMPDPSTFIALPWRPNEAGVARMFCDIQTPERTPYEGDPRHVLRRAVAARREHGL